MTVRLSTSNSDHSPVEHAGPDIPAAPVPPPERVASRRAALRLLVGTFASGAAFLAGSEAVLRARGYPLSVLNDKNLWSVEREKLDRLTPADLALVGTSRVVLDFSLETLQARCPQIRALQLGILSSRPYAVLKDVATRSHFAGTVLCDVPCDTLPAKEGEDFTADWVKYYHGAWDPLHRINRSILTYIQEHLVTAGPTFGPAGISRSVVARSLINPPSEYALGNREVRLIPEVVTPQQFAEAEQNLVKATENQRAEFDRYWAAGPWQASKAEIRGYCQAVRARGGRVVFARFPTSGALREREDQLFPRAEFWEPFVRETGAESIHCDDVPGMHGFHCPDGSHLAVKDTLTFTAALAAEMAKRGWLRTA